MGAAIELAEVRRKRIRSQARDRRSSRPTEPGRFQTPEWLERSFVLPLTEPEGLPGSAEHVLPSQGKPRPDDLATATALALVTSLLLGSLLALGVGLGFGLLAVAAIGVRFGVAAEPVPQLHP